MRNRSLKKSVRSSYRMFDARALLGFMFPKKSIGVDSRLSVSSIFSFPPRAIVRKEKYIPLRQQPLERSIKRTSDQLTYTLTLCINSSVNHNHRVRFATARRIAQAHIIADSCQRNQPIYTNCTHISVAINGDCGESETANERSTHRQKRHYFAEHISKQPNSSERLLSCERQRQKGDHQI